MTGGWEGIFRGGRGLCSWGLLSLENLTLNTWLGLRAWSLIAGIGLQWRILKRRLSGQATVDDGEGQEPLQGPRLPPR